MCVLRDEMGCSQNIIWFCENDMKTQQTSIHKIIYPDFLLTSDQAILISSSCNWCSVKNYQNLDSLNHLTWTSNV